MEFFDCHAHVQFSAYKEDADDVIARAREEGVRMVAPSSQLSTSKRAINYATRFPGEIFAAVGLHPLHLKAQKVDIQEDEGQSFETHGEQFDEEKWRPLVEDSHVVALGEIGLDYVEHLAVEEAERALQEKVYRQQIELALAVGKPIIQHCRSGFVAGVARDANDDALDILDDYVSRGLRGVIHCFSGNWEQAKRYIDLGFLLSFTGLITFNDAWDEVIEKAPVESLLTETDAPYLTPVPHRGKRNEPAYVRFVAEKIADLKHLPLEGVAAHTTRNAEGIFGITKTLERGSSRAG